MGSPVRHRPGALVGLTRLVATGAGAALLGGASAPGEDVSVMVTGLRNGKGQVFACLTADPRAFPDCKSDPAARQLIVPAAGDETVLDFGAVAPGTYAISLFHDENGNGKLDTVLMMPKEGFGFSRDAKVRFGPPRFAAASFTVGGAPAHQTIRMRYMF